MINRKRTKDEEAGISEVFENIEQLQRKTKLIQKTYNLVPIGWDTSHWRTPCKGPKERLTIRLDREMVDWYRKMGRGWQARINDVLHCYQHAMIAKLVEEPKDRTWDGEPL